MNLKTGTLAVSALLIFAAPFFSAPSVAAMPVPAAPVCDEIYVIQSNDWLSKIAEKFLGNRDLYPAIVSATNQQHQTDPSFPQIVDANRIEAGWRLCIPAADAAPQIIADVTTVEPLQLSPPAVLPAEYKLDDYLAEHTFPPGIKADWFLSSPEPVAKYPVLPEHQARRDAYGYRSNYLWNENLSEKYYL
ncbi:MAG: LysM peptidoglycan-binding domain-containing protein, partial [Chloroflexi bacterium]